MAVSSFNQVFELFKNLDRQFFEIVAHTSKVGGNKHPIFIQLCDLTYDLRYRMIQFMATEDNEDTAKIGMEITNDLDALIPVYREWITFLNKQMYPN